MTFEKFEKAREIYKRIENFKRIKKQMETQRVTSLVEGGLSEHCRLTHYESGTKEHEEMKNKICEKLSFLLKEFEDL